uniref:C-type lectin domain-containing protein n=1 Tax=Urocitellus parryii TaxID=9999 RepID=A0A8D2GWV1_UROPR
IMSSLTKYSSLNAIRLERFGDDYSRTGAPWHQLAWKLGCAGIILLLLSVIGLSCPKHGLQLRDKCFTISSSSKTWNNSLADCSQRESSLLLIQDQEELRFIQNMIKYEGNLYWIGLNFTLSEKKWKWINGSLLNHDILKIVGENKENSCAAISNMKVFSESCNSENKWICEKKLKPIRNKVS